MAKRKKKRKPPPDRVMDAAYLDKLRQKIARDKARQAKGPTGAVAAIRVTTAVGPGTLPSEPPGPFESEN